MDKNNPMSIKDLIDKHKNEPELKFIWGEIPIGSKGLIVGVAKSGKTTFAENLAISIALGKDEFFGEKLLGQPKKVLFVNLEESGRIKNLRVKKQIKNLTDKENLLLGENYLTNPEEFPEFMGSDNDWEKLEDLIKKSDAELIIIDSLSHLLAGKIENSQDCLSFTKKFRKYVMSSNKTVIVIHHNIKSNNKPLDQESIAGSRVITQEFEYGIGFANIPNRNGEKYCLSIYNKYVGIDNTLAKICGIDKELWFEKIGEENVYDLYKENFNDARFNDANGKIIISFFKDKCSQGIKVVSSKDLQDKFASGEEKIMSKQTLYQWLKTLHLSGEIIKVEHGKYKYALNLMEGDNEKE
ncbi:AAA family ATPase [Flavobacterium sp.]|uniref:AAA family ATPase n=1 Tax=Flavobacterium sp. TaxID=239 RepID=UPI003D268D08